MAKHTKLDDWEYDDLDPARVRNLRRESRRDKARPKKHWSQWQENNQHDDRWQHKDKRR